MDETNDMQVAEMEKKLPEQECRAELRERFLWAVSSLVGKDVTISMHENTQTRGVFRGVDKDILSAHIQDFKTPLTTYPSAMVRVPDCFSLHFKL